MKQTFFLAVLGVILALQPASGQIMFKKPLSPRNASYTMDITLNTETKQIEGSETLVWRNITSRPAQELQFHLYMNAFKNNKSTFMKETGSSGGKLRREKAWGWVEIHSIRISNGPDLTGSLVYIQPDDNNSNDQTVAKVTLPAPVRPGSELCVDIDFTTQLPVVYRRNGYYKDFFFASQWFPKVGVLEDAGWNCHQFHANSEFYSDYGVYDVSLTLPKEMIIGSTGIPVKTTVNDSLQTIRIRAEDVHDFAWTAWPHWQIAEKDHNGVKIIHLYEKDHSSTVDRTLRAMEMTLDFMNSWAGSYPYPRITVIHAPTGAYNVNGMEYPMFITGGSFWNVPESIKMTENVTVHEFGHNWFYGMVGNNEFEEAWLDEGINSYAECRMMDEFYGKETSMFEFRGFRTGELPFQRLNYIQSPRRDRILRPAWTYIGGGYGTLSYQKPVLMLWTLENMVTRPVMDKIIHTYFQRWKFRHPHSQDFIDVVNEVTGEDYTWYFDQVLKGSGDLDFRLASVWTGRDTEPAGMFDSDSGMVRYPVENDTTDADTSGSEQPEMFRSTVRVQRKGEIIIPVDILLVFEDGDSLTYTWDGKERWARYRVEHPSKLAWAAVDPEGKLVLDTNFANNSKTVEPRKGPVRYISSRFIMFIETALQVMGFLG